MRSCGLTDKKLSKAEIAEYLEQDRQERAEQFRQRFTALCDELQCDMAAVPEFTADGRVTVRFVVQAR